MAKQIDETNLGYLISKIKAAFWPKTDVVSISIDTTPTANSTNLVTSGGVKTYVDNAIPSVPVQDVTVDGTSVVNNQGVAEVPAIPDEVEANPTVPSGTTPTDLTGLKVGNDYYNVASGGGTVTDVTVGGTSVVNNQGVAVVPSIPNDSDLVHKTGNETIGGNKAFTSQIISRGGVYVTEGNVITLDYDQGEGVYLSSWNDSINNELTFEFAGTNGDEQVRLTNIEEPRYDSDAATKHYVDTHGGGGGAGTLDTTATTAQSTSSSESLGGNVTLHKISKTGTYSDLIGTPTYALGESTGGPASLTVGLPYGTIDSTSTGTLMTATVNGITVLRDGVTCIIVNNVVGSEAGYTLNVNNLGPKPVYYFYDDTTQSSTAFVVGKTAMFVYDSTKVSGGCWNMMYPFDSSISASTYLIRTYYSTLPLATALGRYRLVFTSADGTKFVPANSSTSTSATSEKTVTTEKIDPFGKIFYYNTTTTRTAGQTVSVSYQYLQNRLTLGYSFNRTGVALTLTTNAPVYVKCSPQTDGSVKIDGTTPFVQALPNTEDGYVYIFLGIATSATQIELMMNHPVYYFKNGCIRQWTNDDVVHKSGNETITGTKTFDNLCIGSGSIMEFTAGTGENQVDVSLESAENGVAVLSLEDADGGNDVLLRGIHSPSNGSDAANKAYVDGLFDGNYSVFLNGYSGAYGITPWALCAFAVGVSGATMTMEPFTTSGGSGGKPPRTGVKFPIGCKIYYHPDYSGFAASTSFVSKRFYSTYKEVDAKYTAVTGTSISLGSSSSSSVYLRVLVEDGYWMPYYKSGSTVEIIVSSNQLQSGNFYIYLGKKIGTDAYTFQLEDNNLLYYYNGTDLIDWPSYKSKTAYVADSNSGITISNNVISYSPVTFKYDLSYTQTVSSSGSVSYGFNFGTSTYYLPSGTYKVTVMRHAWYDGSSISSDYAVDALLCFSRDNGSNWTYIAAGTYIMRLITSTNDASNMMGSVVIYLTGFLTLSTATTSNDIVSLVIDAQQGTILGGDQPIEGSHIESLPNSGDFILFEKI